MVVLWSNTTDRDSTLSQMENIKMGIQTSLTARIISIRNRKEKCGKDIRRGGSSWLNRDGSFRRMGYSQYSFALSARVLG